MAMQKLKSCPRCNGELQVKREASGWYEECGMCGQRRDVSELVVINNVGQIKVLDKKEIKKLDIYQ
jgi:transcription elongation factor Elf1